MPIQKLLSNSCFAQSLALILLCFTGLSEDKAGATWADIKIQNLRTSAGSFASPFQLPTSLLRQPILLQPTGGFVGDGVFQKPFLDTGIDIVFT